MNGATIRHCLQLDKSMSFDPKGLPLILAAELATKISASRPRFALANRSLAAGVIGLLGGIHQRPSGTGRNRRRQIDARTPSLLRDGAPVTSTGAARATVAARCGTT